LWLQQPKPVQRYQPNPKGYHEKTTATLPTGYLQQAYPSSHLLDEGRTVIVTETSRSIFINYESLSTGYAIGIDLTV
jgi:hypothetical protein